MEIFFRADLKQKLFFFLFPNKIILLLSKRRQLLNFLHANLKNHGCTSNYFMSSQYLYSPHTVSSFSVHIMQMKCEAAAFNYIVF